MDIKKQAPSTRISKSPLPPLHNRPTQPHPLPLLKPKPPQNLSLLRTPQRPPRPIPQPLPDNPLRRLLPRHIRIPAPHLLPHLHAHHRTPRRLRLKPASTIPTHRTDPSRRRRRPTHHTARALAEPHQARVPLVAHARAADAVFAHLVRFAAIRPSGAPAHAAGCRGAADGAALFGEEQRRLVEVAGRRWRVGVQGRARVVGGGAPGCALPDGGDALETGEAGDAVGALGVERVGRGGGGCGGGVVVVRVGRCVSAVAVFDGGCGEGG